MKKLTIIISILLVISIITPFLKKSQNYKVNIEIPIKTKEKLDTIFINNTISSTVKPHLMKKVWPKLGEEVYLIYYNPLKIDTLILKSNENFRIDYSNIKFNYSIIQ